MTDDHAHDHDNDRRIAEAVSAGRLAILETRTSRHGERRRTPVGFAERDDGRVVVAAPDADAAWAADLRSDPRCRHETRGLVFDDVARELAGHEREAAGNALVDAYGPLPLPASAPVFELRPLELEEVR